MARVTTDDPSYEPQSHDPNREDMTGKSEFAETGMRIAGPSKDPLKYRSAPSRFASLSAFQNNANFNEVNYFPGQRSDEIKENLAIRFQSNTVHRDVPSWYSDRLTAKKIANRTFMPQDMIKTWWRKGGEW